MYLTYANYVSMGGANDTATYNDYENLEFEARAIVDWYTFNRLRKETEATYPEALKYCMYKLIQLIRDKQRATALGAPETETSNQTTVGISHEANDGVSITYNTLSAKEAADSIKSSLESTVYMYLQGVRDSLGHKLLYRGIYANE